MLIFKITKYLLIDLALNKFFSTVNNSMTVFLDISEVEVGMYFEKIIYTDIFTILYYDCKILELIDGEGDIKKVKFSFRSKSHSLGFNSIAMKRFDKIVNLIPGKLLEISKDISSWNIRQDIADIAKRGFK